MGCGRAAGARCGPTASGRQIGSAHTTCLSRPMGVGDGLSLPNNQAEMGAGYKERDHGAVKASSARTAALAFSSGRSM